MIDSVLSWGVLALLVFWFVGARNRLTRLRATALQAYAALDAALGRQLEFVRERSGADDVRGEAPRDMLRAAIVQFGTLLAATRSQPLDATAMGALGTALRVLLAAWEQVYPEAAHRFEADGTLTQPAPIDVAASNGEVGRPAPVDVPALAWPEPSPAAEIARGQFNESVARYNAAIAQFPAVLVAWAFRLRASAPLG